MLLLLQMDGVDNSSADDSSSSEEEDEDEGSNKKGNKKRKAALRDADREELEGIGGEGEDEDGIAPGGKVWMNPTSQINQNDQIN